MIERKRNLIELKYIYIYIFVMAINFLQLRKFVLQLLDTYISIFRTKNENSEEFYVKD